MAFDPLTGRWELMDRMFKARGTHSVSVINYSEVAKFCN